MSEDRLDFLLLGATGVTGMYCIPVLQELSKENGRNFTWGVAGRSEKKIKDVLAQVGDKIGVDLSSTPIVLADVNDDESLLKMARKTKILINLCGPYNTLGLPVVEACVIAGTHHLDISGEPEYINSLPEKFNNIAKEKGLYIVSACGLDCLPSDLGLTYLNEKFDGTLNSVVVHANMWFESRDDGPIINFGTWESFVYAVKHGLQFKEMKKVICPEKKYNFRPKLKVCHLPRYSKTVNGWTMYSVACDKLVMEETQKFLYENENRRPVQVDMLVHVQTFWNFLTLQLILLLCMILAPFRCGRWLLLNYPHIFTAGYLKTKDKTPSEETVENCWYQNTFYGEGWKEKLTDKDQEFTVPPNKSILARFKTRNPAYRFSSYAIVAAAIMISSEKEKLPKNGGVYSPGAAFSKTSLMEYLINKCCSFEIIEEKDL
ncbi:saccharopine dehydrogenase-like oxidoreductase [Diorhabda sublineata]|uniref:saccharopine dehydrogenase-like oxidoreductase n=1 Tax=Diorhabda sublineata TaxID=1163346 RepID=UPI0024E11963|nr:saccharopine dehydrogenase-like oxidoreductase [Diorhabda sublineata]